MNADRIPFNKPYLSGKELEYITSAHRNGHLAGDGPFTARCHQWLENGIGCMSALLTHSGMTNGAMCPRPGIARTVV